MSATARAKPRKRRKPNGTAVPFLKVVEIARDTARELTSVTGTQQQIIAALTENASSNRELGVTLRAIQGELAASGPRTLEAVGEVKEHVTDAARRVTATVLAEVADLRVKIGVEGEQTLVDEVHQVAEQVRWNWRTKFAVVALATLTGAVAVLVEKVWPFLKAATKALNPFG